jgi:hypothetical protein
MILRQNGKPKVALEQQISKTLYNRNFITGMEALQLYNITCTHHVM